MPPSGLAARRVYAMDMKRNYYEDIELFKTNTALALTILLLAALVALPFLVGEYALYVLNLIAINSIVAIGLNILVGYTDQVSIGHGAFMSVGAYTAANLAVRLGLQRNAIYKVVFDARRKIRRALAANGYLDEQGLERR